jgi:hypothetical protein
MSSWGCGGRTCVIAMGSTPWHDPDVGRNCIIRGLRGLISLIHSGNSVVGIGSPGGKTFGHVDGRLQGRNSSIGKNLTGERAHRSPFWSFAGTVACDGLHMDHDSKVTGHPPFVVSADSPAIMVPVPLEDCGSRVECFDEGDLSTSADGDSSGKVSVGRIGKQGLGTGASTMVCHSWSAGLELRTGCS